jgi:hypothetical protein
MEGSTAHVSSSSVDLREGLRRFLAPLWTEARRRRVHLTVVACGSREATYSIFRDAHAKHPNALNLLLVDSEEPVRKSPREHLEALDDWDLDGVADEQIHLMVPTMEAWLVADPEALARYYGQGFALNQLPSRQIVEGLGKVELFAALKSATRNTRKREYSKTRHAFEILAQLDPDKVRVRAPRCGDFLDMIERYILS